MTCLKFLLQQQQHKDDLRLPFKWIGLSKPHDWYFTRDENSYIWTEYSENNNKIVISSYTQLSIGRNDVDNYLWVLLRNKNENEEQKFVRIDNRSMFVSDNVSYFYRNTLPFFSNGFWKENEGKIVSNKD